MSHDTMSFVALCTGLLVFLLVVSVVSKNYSLNRIKSKTVGDGQHGTARWATLKEIGKTYAHIPFDVAHWRKGERLPQKQGVVVGSMGRGKKEQRRIAALGRTAVRYVKKTEKKRPGIFIMSVTMRKAIRKWVPRQSAIQPVCRPCAVTEMLLQ